jgi:hypothetical protein
MGNIARLAFDRDVSLIVLQECPCKSKTHGACGTELVKKLNCLRAGQLLYEREWEAQSLHVGNAKRGEEQVFCYDPRLLSLVGLPAALPLQQKNGGKVSPRHPTQTRPPGVAVFAVAAPQEGFFPAAAGAPAAADQLVVVNCHLKSGGGKETLEDLDMVCSSVRALLEKAWGRAKRGEGQTTVAVLGDFNLKNPQPVKLKLDELGRGGWQMVPDPPEKSSMWRFCKTGDEVPVQPYRRTLGWCVS